MNSRLTIIDIEPTESAMRGSTQIISDLITMKKAEDDKIAMQEDVMSTAFNDIFALYGNEITLAQTLKSAKEKLADLKEELYHFQDRIKSLERQVEHVVRELQNLEQKVSQETKEVARTGADVDRGDADIKYVSVTIAGTKAFVKRSKVYIHYRDNFKKIQVDIERTTRYIKMLEGAKVVADAGGMKRPRDDASERGIGNDQKKAKQLTCLKPKSEC